MPVLLVTENAESGHISKMVKDRDAVALVQYG